MIRAFRIHGRVQGVGFRAATAAAAEKAGIDAGFVRNEARGTVLAVARGEAAALERLVAFLGDGPPWAAVERLEELPLTGELAQAELPQPFSVVTG